MQDLKVEGNGLYSPIVNYRNNTQLITVISTFHIGSSSYYQTLQDEINIIPEGYFESCDRSGDSSAIIGRKKNLFDEENLAAMISVLATMLGVKPQSLQYPPSWEKADISLEEVIALLPENHYDKLRGNIQEVFSLWREYSTSPQKVRRKLHSSLRTEIEQGNSRSSESDSIILDKRNQALFDKLQPRILLRDFIQLGIVYGAGHLVGIDHFLVEDHSYTPESISWVPFMEVE